MSWNSLIALPICIVFVSALAWPSWAQRLWGERIACLVAWLAVAFYAGIASMGPIFMEYCRQFEQISEDPCGESPRAVLVLLPIIMMFTGVALWLAVARTGLLLARRFSPTARKPRDAG